MDIKTTKVFFALLRSAITEAKLTETELNNYSPKMLDDLLEVALKHDMLHLFALGMKQNGLIPEGDELGLGKCIFKAVYRYERLKYDYDSLCDILENAKIPFLPLKGSVIRQYYPEAWMRTSCDIDILVHEEDLDKTVDFLINDCGYTYHKKGTHDVSLFSVNGVHIELHYTLMGKGVAKSSREILRDVWKWTKPKEAKSFWYEMPDELFYFYHIAHMAKHIEEGGCGVRPFIDLMILDNLKDADIDKRNQLLKEGGLLKFAEMARKLSKVWFDNLETDEVLKQLEDYLLYGGVYGNDENRIAVQQQKKGGKIGYALSKIFIPYDVIKFHYPILEKHKWLTPVMEIRRWGKLIFCGHLKRTTDELKFNSNITDEQAKVMRDFLDNIGL